MPISKPHSSMASKNKGSSSALVDYLDKENQELEKMALSVPQREKEIEIRSRQQHFFNSYSDKIRGHEVTEKIDANISKLGKNDAKFFAPTINFSKGELKFLASKATDGRSIENTWQMNPKEFERFNQYLKEYSRKVMDNYAQNFMRQEKGLNDGSGLVYFAKIEHIRKYKGTDKKVQQGFVKSGEKKEGLQSHIHIIVSRKDKTQKMKLSPLSNEKSKIRTIGKNSYKVGFDRKKWIVENEKRFDKMFHYKRQEIEKFEVQNALKNGSMMEREATRKKLSKSQEKTHNNHKSLER
ncbi:DUF5712 family protein [Arenibacter certesii]|uniref:Mobilization protein n=2 Tax=Arenibacter certesii TaxID=228955 RepID=A0A918J3T2_9FLAO|nr:DUF5712 family protein [Arenibacter certesii]GGW43931.1 hypothetical protein GCM10007383_30590 [Arenibacter certesii]